MTTHQRPITHEERAWQELTCSEWVVDAATGRVVRRQRPQTLHQVADALSEAMHQAAMNLDSSESDVRLLRGVEDSRSETSEPSEHPQRSSEVRARSDNRAANRQHWDE